MIALKVKELGKLLAKKQVGIPLLVVATALITTATVLTLVGNDQPIITSASSVKGDSTKYPSTTERGSEETPAATTEDTSSLASTPDGSKPKTTTGSTAQPTKPKGSGTQTPGATTPTTPTPTTPTPKPQPTGSVAFSSDGCFVTLTGAPGWTLTGVAEGGFDENGNPRKGANLIDPAYVMTTNGPVTVQVGVSGYSQADWRLTAHLSDTSGKVMATKVIYVGSSAPVCS